MSTFPFPTEDEFLEAWTATMDVLDKGIAEDVKNLGEAMQKLYGHGLSKEQAELAQLLLITVHKSTHRLTLAIVNTYLCTDRAKREQLERIRLRMEGKPEPEES
jgi:hypothetical protein